MNASAVIGWLNPEMASNFEVMSSVEFYVARASQTRILPTEKYYMNFTIKANKDFIGNMTEAVEPGFGITAQDGLTVETFENYKLLHFNVTFVNGSTYNIGYEYDAPDISPELYLLGPLRIGNFTEARIWMIASDQPAGFGFNYTWPDAGAPGMNLVGQLVGGTFSSEDYVEVNSSGNIT